ncbi:MAG TPA: DUF1579 family protein [Vicinamibacterales bacterium]|nr:DUF1579 family protein [Vicinamibacterales bacterium]
MRRAAVVSLIVGVALAAVAGAQQPATRKPGPDVEQLRYFIGTWRTEADMQASMVGPAGKVAGTLTEEWMPGGFFVVTHHEETNPTGTHKALMVTGYDAKKHVYVRYFFDGEGGVEYSEGTHSGGTWTWVASYAESGSTLKTRSVVVPRSATSYDFTWEIAPHGDDWTVVQRGTATRIN